MEIRTAILITAHLLEHSASLWCFALKSHLLGKDLGFCKILLFFSRMPVNHTFLNISTDHTFLHISQLTRDFPVSKSVANENVFLDSTWMFWFLNEADHKQLGLKVSKRGIFDLLEGKTGGKSRGLGSVFNVTTRWPQFLPFHFLTLVKNIFPFNAHSLKTLW